MLKIKKVLITGIVGVGLAVGFSGCGASFEPHPQTIKFAKEHNLKNKDYQKSEIACITSKPLSSKDMKELLAIIMSKMSHYYLTLCKDDYLKRIERLPKMNWSQDYNRCKHYAIPSVKESISNVKKVNNKIFKHEFKYYDGIYHMNDDKGELLAYLGIDETLGYDILYLGDITEEQSFYTIHNPTKIGIIRESINEFKKRHPNQCQTLK